MTSEIKSLSFTVAEELEGLRLDKGISEFYEDISRSRINGLIKEGGVLVNGRSAKASYRLEAGDEVSFSLASAEIPDIEPEDIPIDILYEDEDILIVNILVYILVLGVLDVLVIVYMYQTLINLSLLYIIIIK